MPKRASSPHDFTVVARRVVEQAIGEKLKRFAARQEGAERSGADHAWSTEEITELLSERG
jgi:hypothetical protein